MILGGARSGKSAYAQRKAEAMGAGRRLVFIATAQPFDVEMTDRIEQHRAARDARWTTLEAPVHLPEAVSGLAPTDVAVVDCLTLWLSNLLIAEADLQQAGGELTAAVTSCSAHLFIVSNEVGWGIVPDNPLARRFRDEAGRLHQRLSAEVDESRLVVAGRSLRLTAD